MDANKIVEIIKANAKIKLERHIETMKLSDVDGKNISVEIPDGYGWVEEQNGKIRKFVRAEKVLMWLREALYEKLIYDFEKKEKKEFLNDVQALRDYLNDKE